MDDYDADLQVENEFDAADPWWDENQVKLDQCLLPVVVRFPAGPRVSLKW